MGSCYFCSAPVDDDYFCFGCEEHICDNCNKSEMCSGRHAPECHEGTDNDYEREE